MTQPTQQPGWHQATLDTPHGSAVAYAHGPHADEASAKEATRELGVGTHALVSDAEGRTWIVPK